jgi:hypothetical protein
MDLLINNYANTNLRWCLRAWNDGEMQDLALYLFRKAISQLAMADLSTETITGILVNSLGLVALETLTRLNTEITEDPAAYAEWVDRVACLHIC